jgi:ATP-dependent RNA helicase RhlE
MPFSALGLAEPLVRALRDEGYASPTPIQQRAIPPVLEGRDVLGCAQTGTGKTAAFALPILQRLSAHLTQAHPRPIRCLVLTPTRELAAQIGESFRAYGRHLRLSHTVIFGGVGQHPQVQALRRGVDVLVATPGRLLDLMNQGHVRLDKIEIFVLDEADRMLDMGFINDIRKVVRVIPQKRQTLFFSATMPREIQSLADSLLHDPVRVEVAAVSSAAETVAQSLYFVAKADKPALLKHLLADRSITRALVFSRTKHGADKVCRHLEQAGIRAEAIHGNKSQNARIRALEGFRKGTTRVLVASDIAARGLDIDGISHVVNYDLPNEPETYVHRIGRTGRAGASGIALSFCDGEERAYLRDIERTIRKPVPVVAEHPFAAGAHAPAPARSAPHHGGGQRHGQGGQRFGQRDQGRRGGGGYGQRDHGRREAGHGGHRDSGHGGGHRDRDFAPRQPATAPVQPGEPRPIAAQANGQQPGRGRPEQRRPLW